MSHPEEPQPGEATAIEGSIATMQVDVQYHAESFQQCSDARVNPFAVQLLAESLGDKEALVEAGVLFSFPFDHAGRPVWVIVTAQAPQIVSVRQVPDVNAETEGAK